MKRIKSNIIIVFIVLLALGAAVYAVLRAAPINRPAGIASGPSAAVSSALPAPPTPSAAPSPSPAPSATSTPTPTPEPSPSAIIDGPLSGYIIGIDPGHQAIPNSDTEPVSPGSSELKACVSEGAYGSFTRLPEYELNLSVALKLKDKLESLGATVVMTRETNDVDIPNSQRAQVMNGAAVDCWLRIHANNSSDANIHGMYLLVPAQGCLDTPDDTAYKASLRLANALFGPVLSSTGAYNRGIIKRSDQTGFNWSNVPVCAIEMGFMTNEDEDRLLASGDYQQKIADGLAQGFVDYFSK